MRFLRFICSVSDHSRARGAQTRQGHDVPIPTWGNLDFAESGAFSSVATPPMYTTTLRVLGGSR